MSEREEWRPCPGASKYVISNAGNVRRKNEHDLTIYLVSGVRNKKINHLSVRLVEDTGEVKHRAVHRLVCEAFNGPPPYEGAACVFKDGDLRNFAPSNLVWVEMSTANLATRSRKKAVQS